MTPRWPVGVQENSTKGDAVAKYVLKGKTGNYYCDKHTETVEGKEITYSVPHWESLNKAKRYESKDTAEAEAVGLQNAFPKQAPLIAEPVEE